jgi:hypothetical protein
VGFGAGYGYDNLRKIDLERTKFSVIRINNVISS